MYHYYIYFRIAPEHATEIKAAVQQLQSVIHAQLGISGRLLTKCDEPNTWMEVYENIAETFVFEAALRLAEEQSGIAKLLSLGETRHLECFKN